ncbi:nucleotide-diphospho-sugar transferase [Blakeslea trispora]|nr:nucleotide-diphospho-sugar transferase [Blakeslea trispora]
MKLDWRGVNSKLQVKAAFVSVVHENDLYALRVSMLDIEDRFNRLYGYPWIIISEKALSRKFRQWITSSTTAPVFFGQAPAIEWNEPYWVDIQLAEKNLRKLVKTTDTIDGESMNFRKMTRYNAGFLAYHPLLRPLEYYWRIHPGSRYTCDILQDPFEKMKREKKKFAFAAAITEDHNNLEGFQDQVIEFIQQNKDMIVPTNKSIYKALLNEATRNMPSNPSDPISEYQGHFSNCMIYNSFTIASLDFLRSKKYTKFFEALDLSGGFFYHKWGESMPQTVAAALLLEKFEIANDLLVGFEHKHLSICPSDFSSHVQARCTCTQFDYRSKSSPFI